jgi:putative ABC transport system ATP-binding protein
MIQLTGVEKVYRTDRLETVALSNINLDVEPASFISIMGPSGSGKSTLLNVLGLLDSPSKGTVQLNGTPILSRRDKDLARLRNEQIGFIFQTFHLIYDLSVLDNVELPLIYRRISGAERRKLALAALERVGLASRVHHFPSQLSGGQQQRVAIARALAHRPALVLADEPTGNLDTASSDDVFELMRSMNREQGTTFLVVTHDPRIAERCGRVVEIVDGRIVKDAARA